MTDKRDEPPATPTDPAVDEAGSRALTEALSSSFALVKWLLLALVAAFLITGRFTVESNEVAVVLRFGRAVGEGESQLLKPGWHWKLPAPIDEVVKIPIGQSHPAVSTAGWYATTPELEAAGKEPPARGSLQPGADGYVLMADGNIIHVRAKLNYRVQPGSALDYQFSFISVTNMVQNTLDNALFYAASRFTADEALYRDTARFREVLLKRVQDQVEKFNLGITLEPSEVKVAAPLAVRPAFEAVLAAAQDRGKKISEARGQAEELLRKAQGEATAIVNAGVAASNQTVQAVVAEARYFTDQLKQYERDPELFRQRLLTETMQRVLTNAQDKFFLPTRADGQARELRIQLNREPQKPAAPEPKK